MARQRHRLGWWRGGRKGEPIAPVRTCIGCRKRRNQDELVRFARSADGTITPGRTIPGRGAWLCADTLEACRAQAERRDAFARALRKSR